VDEARQVLDRLDRIERLRRDAASAPALLTEVRALLLEGEAWIQSEHGAVDGADQALARMRDALRRGENRAMD
jgi:hypothetical protein